MPQTLTGEPIDADGVVWRCCCERDRPREDGVTYKHYSPCPDPWPYD